MYIGLTTRAFKTVARTPPRSTSTAQSLGHGRLVKLSANVLNSYKPIPQLQLTQSLLICIAIAVRAHVNPDIPFDIVHDNSPHLNECISAHVDLHNYMIFSKRNLIQDRGSLRWGPCVLVYATHVTCWWYSCSYMR
jgi:hypothetical protein